MTTNRAMKCPDCGAQMAIRLTKGERRFYAHCPGCGRMQFGPAQSVARLDYSDAICQHSIERTPCKRGFTSWCPICRVRTFTYTQDR